MMPCLLFEEIAAQEEPDAPWDARQKLKLSHVTTNGIGHGTGPWRTTPATFAPDKYRLLTENNPDDASDPLSEPSLMRQTCRGRVY